eukprot:TRINITY_DN4056_c0_g2_i1.p1 TRINITY_DN4056_c0_g2~~TRINITY_DN4056_c0_g2_i1.p1  ORF type:complete len:1011 (+),score=315.98 TRINITY_DN4056_c0_g2_i1:87-3119(+)
MTMPRSATKRKEIRAADYSDVELGSSESDHDEYTVVEIGPLGGFGVWNALSILAGVCSLLLVLHMYPIDQWGWRRSARPGSDLKLVTKISYDQDPKTPEPAKGFVKIEVTDHEGRLPASMGGGILAKNDVTVATWNVGPPSYNPFAYWTSSPHDELIAKAEAALADLKVSDVFSATMYTQFKDTIGSVDRIPTCLETFWAAVGKMTVPDFLSYVEEKGHIMRIEPLTSPLIQKNDVHFRPSAVTCSEGRHADLHTWWDAWKEFIFKTDVTFDGRTGTLYGLLKSKTCTGVDILSLAVYDAAMYEAFTKTGQDWQKAKEQICEKIKDTSDTVIAALDKNKGPDVIFLQGVTRKLIDKLWASALARTEYILKAPARFDTDRSTNTAILLKVGRFIGITEVTSEVFSSEVGSAATVVTATRVDKASTKLLLSSFLGDPSHLETLHNYVAMLQPPRKLIAGCSSRVDELSSDDIRSLRKLETVQLTPAHTALYSKTHTQHTASEAVKQADKTRTPTKEAADYIVFSSTAYTQGEGKCTMHAEVLPTFDFPVVHGVVTGTLKATMASDEAMLDALKDLRKQLTPATPEPTALAVVEEVKMEKMEEAAQTVETAAPANETKAGEEMMVPSPDEPGHVSENGSVQLPPEGTMHYINLPEGALYPQSAVESREDITVTAVCDNGLGDRLGSLYSAVVLAHQLKAKFHIIWNVNNECRARLAVLFSFKGSSSSVANHSVTDNLETKMYGKTNDFDAIITLKHHFSTGHLLGTEMGAPTPPGGDGQWLCGEARKVPLGADSAILRWAQDRQRKGLRTHILHHIDRLAQGLDLKMVAAALAYYNFRINPTIMGRVESFTARHKINPKNTVGVHLRGTDARIPLRMNDVITDVRLRFNTRTFFVCSDDKDAENKFLSAFAGRAVGNTMKTHYPGKMNASAPFRIQGVLGAGRFNVERGEPAVVDALTDMAILSRTERPVIDGVLRDSSFGKMSTTLCVIRLSCDEELAQIAESVPAPVRPGQ